jgi:DNA-binding MarR family transcriptional regulator
MTPVQYELCLEVLSYGGDVVPRDNLDQLDEDIDTCIDAGFLHRAQFGFSVTREGLQEIVFCARQKDLITDALRFAMRHGSIGGAARKINFTDFVILAVAGEEENISFRDVMTYTRLTYSPAFERVKDLERRGYLEETYAAESSGKRTRTTYALTPKGQRFLEEVGG